MVREGLSSVEPNDAGAAFQIFQPGDLFAQFGDLTEPFAQQRLKLCTVQRGKGGGRRHMMQRVDAAESAQGKSEELTTLLPLLRQSWLTY